MKEEVTVWQARFKAKLIFIVTPRWFEARFVALTIFVAEREEIEITECKRGRDPQQIADRGYEVYEVILGKESRIDGAVKLFPTNH